MDTFYAVAKTQKNLKNQGIHRKISYKKRWQVRYKDTKFTLFEKRFINTKHESIFSLGKRNIKTF